MLTKLINNLEEIVNNLNPILAESVSNTDSALLDVHADQLKHGKSGSGERIGKYKNKQYRRKKFDMNPLAGYGNVDLKLTGEFQRERRVVVFSDSYAITSLDSKTDQLVEKYGDIIFNLSPVYQKQYVNTAFRAAAFAEFKKQLFL